MRKLILAIASIGVLASASVISGQAIRRSFSKTERIAFGPGGTVSIVGAPIGAISITGTSSREVEITADIELTATSEADIQRLAQVTTFVVDDSLSNMSIVTTGTHNKLGDKKFWKKFPAHLMSLPFRIDYTIGVPRYTDLAVTGGKGDLVIDGVEGGFTISSLESNARINLLGGSLVATFGSGTVDISMPDRSWRGSAIEAALATGTMTVNLPNSLSAELDASILKSGLIENSLINLKPRNRKAPITDKAVIATAGNGGTAMKFTVGDGTLWLRPIKKIN